jgi:REP element-mobilizing transposase RayT
MSLTAINLHIVFSTKERRPFLKGELLGRTCRYIDGVAHNHNSYVIACGGMPDHVHLACRVPSTVAVSALLQKRKGDSSKWVHAEFPNLGTFQWQDGYSAFSVSPSVMPSVKKYIHNQREHHAKLSFEDEIKALPRKHGMDFDERYVLG